MARSRNPDDYDDEPEERPQRRPRDEDDEPEERPRRRRRRDDDDDAPSSGSGNLGPLDKTFRDTNIVVLILFGFCCNGIAFILALICLLTAKDPKAKSNSLIVLIISGVITVLAVIGQVLGGAARFGGGGR